MEKHSLKIQWTDDLSTGHLPTDNQHRMLIDIINELADAIEKDETPIKMNEILQLLYHYTEWHFEREEECMARTKCPLGEKNKKAHCIFIDKLKAFQNEYREDPSKDFAERVYKELINWLLDHIRGIDTGLRAYVSSEP
ncbi:MAG: bacteriohemerythrin [Bacteroidota bacterium]